LVDLDYNKIIDEIKKDLCTTIQNSSAKIISKNLPVVKGHETELRLLFQNFIINAIKFKKLDIPPIITIQAVKHEKY
jgi:chemotaxis family two-component system sensor kinase Cph1